MTRINRYTEFTPNIQKNKTKIWSVINIKSKYLLGYIRWYPFWGEYSFFPQSRRVLKISCMQEIIKFIQDHKDERNEVTQK